jgi:hypothetical protein
MVRLPPSAVALRHPEKNRINLNKLDRFIIEPNFSQTSEMV